MKMVFAASSNASGSLGNNHVLFLLEDAAKTIFIGTDAGGLQAMDPQTGIMSNYGRSTLGVKGTCGDYVLGIHEDAGKRLWVGTWGDGLSILDRDRKQFTHYTHRPGDSSSLGGDNIYSIVGDNDQDIWL